MTAPVARWLGTLAAVVLLAFLASGAIARASADATETRVRAEMRDSVALVVARAHQERVLALDSARRAFAQAERTRRTARARVDTVWQATDATVDSLRPDTTANVQVALAAYDSLAVAFRAYMRADSASHAAIAAERAATDAALSSADAALAAMTQARDAWKRAATCRTVFRIKCPTRTQAFVAGAVVTLGVTLAVRR